MSQGPAPVSACSRWWCRSRWGKNFTNNFRPKRFVAKKVILGEMASLHCIYDMEGEELYSVKWYKVT